MGGNIEVIMKGGEEEGGCRGWKEVGVRNGVKQGEKEETYGQSSKERCGWMYRKLWGINQGWTIREDCEG